MKKLLAIVLIPVLLWGGCAVIHHFRCTIPSVDFDAARPAVEAIGNTDNKSRRGDVIFVHGLGGDSHGTWTNGAFYWPNALAKAHPDIGVWALNYDSSVSDWFGQTMPIEDRSKNLLVKLRAEGIGEYRIVFVCHSLGGIVVKQMLNHGDTLNNSDFHAISSNTRGVVFLGTPNSGADIASALDRLAPIFRTNITQEQLRRNAPILRNLNDWYRENSEKLELENLAFFENWAVCGSPIVDAASANPGITGVTPVACDADHFGICKPPNDGDYIYKTVWNFIDQRAIPVPTRYNIDISDFILEYKKAKEDGARLDAFKRLHVNQEVVWNATIRQIFHDKKKPGLLIGASSSTKISDCVLASFRPWDFKTAFKIGDTIRLRGVIKKESNLAGAILQECREIEDESASIP